MFSWSQYIDSLAYSSPLRNGFSVLEHLGALFGDYLLTTILAFIFVLEFWAVSYSWRRTAPYIFIVTFPMYLLRTFVPFMFLVHNFLINIIIFIALKAFEPRLSSLKIILGLLITNLLLVIGTLILFSSIIFDEGTILTLPSLLFFSYIELFPLFVGTIILIVINRKKRQSILRSKNTYCI